MMSRKPLADLALAIAAHQANLARLGEAWGQRIVDQLDDSDRAMIARLRDLLREVQENYRINSGKSLQQLEYIRRKVEEIRVKAFVKAEKALRAEAESLIDNETKWSRKILAELSGEKASRFADLTPKQITRVLDNGVIGNRPWADWWTYTADADVQRIANVVNAGLVQGFTTEKIVQNIMGTRAGNYADGVLSTSRNSARRLARTMCSGLANQAKDEFYRQNDDLITAVEWLSTLDGRACPECAGLDRVRWETGERHPVPPLHPSCRCVLLPVTELTDLGAGAARPMANADFDAEARRAYEEKYPGKKYDDLSAATRKRYYHQAIHAYEDRTGKPAFSRAPGSMSFREYFGRMSDRQKRDWLGPELYARWKAGKFSIRDYLLPQPDRSFTVKQLKDLDKKAFALLQGQHDLNPNGLMNISAPFTEDEVSSLRRYTCGEDGVYGKINRYMQADGNLPTDKELEKMISNIRSGMTKSTSAEEITVYRGIKNDFLFEGLLKGKKDVAIDSFQSTSVTREISSERYAGHEPGKSILMKITVPKGTHCIDVSRISAAPQPEDEILLNAAGKFSVKSVYYDQNASQLVVEAIYEP